MASQSRSILPEVPKCPNCMVAYSEERVPQRFACRQHDCCKNCADQFLKVGITQCPECRIEIGQPTTDRWLLRLAVFVRKAREAQRKRLDDGKPLTIEAKNAIESAYAYLEQLFGPNGSAANGKIPLSNEIPSVPQAEEIECVMCLEVFSEQMKPVRLTCNHCVCAECAGEWTSNCPKCRASCNQEDVEVDESLLAMAIFYTDLADTVEDAKLTGGNAPANREILDVLEEIHAYTKRVLCGPSQAAPPAAANSVAAAGSRPANGVDEEAAAEEEFQRQLAMAIAASQAAADQTHANREQEQEEEWQFQRRLHEAMQLSVNDMHRHNTMARQQARQYAAHPPPPSRPPPPAPSGYSPQAAHGAAMAVQGVPVQGLGGAWCTQCGTQSEAGDRFCMECGELLEHAAQAGGGEGMQAPAVSTEEWLASQWAEQNERERAQREAAAAAAAAAAAGEVRRKKKGSTVKKFLSFGLIKG